MNSGAALLSLSFDCPVLAPNQGSLAELADCVGTAWLQLYDGELTADILRDAVQWGVLDHRPDRAPLEELSAEAISSKTVMAYQALLPESSLSFSKEVL